MRDTELRFQCSIRYWVGKYFFEPTFLGIYLGIFANCPISDAKRKSDPSTAEAFLDKCLIHRFHATGGRLSRQPEGSKANRQTDRPTLTGEATESCAIKVIT